MRFIRRAVAATVGSAAIVLAAPAYIAMAAPVAVVTDTGNPQHLNGQVANVLISLILPALVGFFTTHITQPAVKALGLSLLSIVTGAVTNIVANDGTWYWRSTAISIAISFATAVVTYYGLLKPVGLTSSMVRRPVGPEALPVETPGTLARVGVTAKNRAA
jgi:peptidoglycan/LPS O-acetylase OafA/YrhL